MKGVSEYVHSCRVINNDKKSIFNNNNKHQLYIQHTTATSEKAAATEITKKLTTILIAIDNTLEGDIISSE